jgi:endonuclease/exonuclease/phosphatase family metal-dependent hydrolase
MSVRIATWNLEWARPGSKTEQRIQGILNSLDADILVLTEASIETVPQGGYVVEADGSWGYEPKSTSLRKVFMWSKNPWSDVRTVGPDNMPGGRFVAGKTITPDGPVAVIGVCIPWRDAHVRSGMRNRSQWEDHQSFIESLQPILACAKPPFVLAGDFNQKIPRTTAPKDVSELLLEACNGLSIVTEGSGDSALIDHVALSEDLVGKLIQVLPQVDEVGKLTDHLGAVVEFEIRNPREG